MKTVYVVDIIKTGEEKEIEICGWINSKRVHGKLIFFDISDATGTLQVIVSREKVSEEVFDTTKYISLESVICVIGGLQKTSGGWFEIEMHDLKVISASKKQFSPPPRSELNMFSDESMVNHFLGNRHIYIRNPKMIAMMKVRHKLLYHMRNWFHENRFYELTAPILTPVPLYNDESAMSLDVHGEKIFLTQCVGYYLEASVQALERVYNIGPSFRNEESRSKRHLMEYWHIKAEITFANLEDIISMVESVISYLTSKLQEEIDFVRDIGADLCLDGLKIPFERISYREALKILSEKGFDVKFGKSLGSDEEEELSKIFNGPLWIIGIPCVIEPFPYVIDEDDPEVTKTADLIASNGCGELLGVAEKIYDTEVLLKRMEQKNRADDDRFKWIKEVHEAGCAPHAAFGMGLERLIRWLVQVPHVRDTIPFPRAHGRKIYP